jgi:putative oxidoreductase
VRRGDFSTGEPSVLHFTKEINMRFSEKVTWGPLLGRILMSVIFVAAGLGKLMGFTGTVGYIASQGIPLPNLVAAGTIALEIGGGLMLILGWHARWAAGALALFTGLAALIFHNFWAADAAAMQDQLIHFQKNLAIMGGLLYVVLHGSGPYSLRHDE